MNPERRTEVLHRIIIVALALAVAAPVVLKSRPSEFATAPAAFSVTTSARGYVRISGDVRHPGIYPYTANMVTTGAINLAAPLGGPTAYLPVGSAVYPLKNGTDIRVELRGDGSATIIPGSMPTAQRLVLGIPLDINAMNEADFDRVPGIGPVLAGRIVAHRQKNGGSMTVQELCLIEGIGKKKYLRLRKFFN